MSIISFASCTNDIENLDIIPTNNGQNTEGNIILQERNPNLPLPLIKKIILNKPQTRNSVSGEDRTFLGDSYKIKNGDYIAIGSGTTTYLLATCLHDRQDLTIVTDSFPVANELLHDDGITLYIAGGWIMKRNSSCRGLSAERFFKELTVDKSYCGADSINVNVGTSSVDFDPRTEICVSKCGVQRYVLVDSSKFNVRPFIDKVMKIEDIHHVITNDDVSKENIDALKASGVDVLLA